jgi:hypothetical protein
MMKFMIVNKPNGHEYAKAGSRGTNVDTLKKLLKNGTVEVAYSTVAGGHIYVVKAADTEDLVRKVRLNPFFHDSDTEVIPLMDAVDFIEGIKAEVE